MLTLNRQVHARGFSIIAVVGTLIIMGLLMVSALQVVQDHRRRATLSADHALALSEAEAALATAECRLAFATGTPSRGDCPAISNPARDTTLDPVTLAGFVAVGTCGNDDLTRWLCIPRAGQTAQELAKLLQPTTLAAELPEVAAMEGRIPAHHARYVIEPIPDVQPGQWMHAGTASAPHLFRITAAGFGTNDDVNVLLQVVYRPRVAQP